MEYEQKERPAFIFTLVVISLVFGYMMLPFFGVLMWSCIIALLFHPFYKFLLTKTGCKENLSAFITLALCLIIVVFPALFIMGSLVQQGLELYELLDSGDVDPTRPIEFLKQNLPLLEEVLNRFNLDVSELKEKMVKHGMGLTEVIAKNSFSVGQNTVQFFISLGLFIYVSFFFIKDGEAISRDIYKVIPLEPERIDVLTSKFREVTRATIKGNLAIATLQGVLGGIIFGILGLPAALLWGVVMIVLSLIPVVGAALIWIPAAIALLASGDWPQALVLVLFGVLVIGLVDNILRPVLVGRDTKLPDYLVLLSTLGGLTLFGPNGFILGPLVAVLFITSWQLLKKA